MLLVRRNSSRAAFTGWLVASDQRLNCAGASLQNPLVSALRQVSSLASHMGSGMHDRRIGVLAALFDAPLVLLLARQAVAGRSTGAAVIERC